MQLILVDTGVISRAITNKSPYIDALQFIGNESIVISSVTKIELYNWINLSKNIFGKKAYLEILNQINALKVVEIDRKISFNAVNLAIKNNTKVADILIAATAITNKLQLLTKNKKDFIKIKGIKLYNYPEI